MDQQPVTYDQLHYLLDDLAVKGAAFAIVLITVCAILSFFVYKGHE